MSVDILADGTNARSQQRSDCKGEGLYPTDYPTPASLLAGFGENYASRGKPFSTVRIRRLVCADCTLTACAERRANC